MVVTVNKLEFLWCRHFYSSSVMVVKCCIVYLSFFQLQIKKKIILSTQLLCVRDVSYGMRHLAKVMRTPQTLAQSWFIPGHEYGSLGLDHTSDRLDYISDKWASLIERWRDIWHWIKLSLTHLEVVWIISTDDLKIMIIF